MAGGAVAADGDAAVPRSAGGDPPARRHPAPCQRLAAPFIQREEVRWDGGRLVRCSRSFRPPPSAFRSRGRSRPTPRSSRSACSSLLGRHAGASRLLTFGAAPRPGLGRARGAIAWRFGVVGAVSGFLGLTSIGVTGSAAGAPSSSPSGSRGRP
ncbi:MAG: hypothetical protein MZV64_72385 [Ignavibacteriales bacterium]|nr:hypothetical protein [Ignavibacteriales bacterium]